MTILLAHNHYQQAGGEDQVFRAEVDLLRSRGHRVIPVAWHNDRISQMGGMALAGATLWNRASYREFHALVRRHRPAVVHFHNTFPLISPSAYYAARGAGAAVVQTLHNFRLLCPNALFFRDGHACEACMGKTPPWQGVVHGCYRGNRVASAVTAAMLTVHRALGTWRRMVDVYIALSPSSRGKLIQGGLPADKIVIKPNFLDPDPLAGNGSGGYAIWVGRLSVEKGLPTLLKAWERLAGEAPIKIVGDGPLAPLVQEAARRDPTIQWLGRQPPQQVHELIGDARFLILSSECYENFPRTIVEAFAKGTPVIASRLGAMADLVRHRQTGLLFAPHDAEDLADQVRTLLNTPEILPAMRRAARAEFEQRYTGECNHRQLMAIYRRAIAKAQGRRRTMSLS